MASNLSYQYDLLALILDSLNLLPTSVFPQSLGPVNAGVILLNILYGSSFYSSTYRHIKEIKILKGNTFTNVMRSKTVFRKYN